ncbi:MAG: hypothetical protein WCS94_21850 [Verrucomicrobiota bacterium]
MAEGGLSYNVGWFILVEYVGLRVWLFGFSQTLFCGGGMMLGISISGTALLILVAFFKTN